MRRARTIGASLALAATIAAAGGLTACDTTPTRPSAATPASVPPAPGDAPVSIARLTIDGPDTVHLGETAQFTAIAHLSDGSTRDVTRDAAWRSTNASVLTVSETGLVTGRDRGEATISMSLGGRGASKGEVIVVPAGTYRLIGALQDGGVAVPDALVEARGGSPETMRISASGFYRLYGVSGDTEVTVIKDGYETATRRLTITGHQRLDFDLVLARPRQDISGTYTLTITAAAECAAALPGDALQRTHTARVTQEGARVSVALDGGTFFHDGNRLLNRFNGSVGPDRVTFQLGEFDYYYLPDVLEALTPTTYLFAGGSVVAPVSRTALAGTLDGLIGTMQIPQFKRLATCRSAAHRFLLSR
jgi:hypothetical protein